LQVAPDQSQRALVRDPLGQSIHHDVVVDAVEERKRSANDTLAAPIAVW
jgi:hypothetical protein